MTVSQLDIGIDPLSTPAGFFGSPLISSLKGTENLIPIDSHLIVDYKQSTPSWPGITIMFWLRFDDKELQAGNIPILVSITHDLQKLKVNSDTLYRPSIFIFSPINTRIKPQIEDGLSLKQRIIGLVSNLILIKMEPILSLKFLATVGYRNEFAYSD